jgi:hypothetical protein
VYRWAVSAVAAIGVGAFAVSFLALRDLMRVIGYSSATAWIFPAIIDTAVAVSTMMLVALGDKPARRTRTVTPSANTPTPAMQRLAQPPTQSAKAEVTRLHRPVRGHRRYEPRGYRRLHWDKPTRHRPCRTQRKPRRHRRMQTLGPG